MSDQVQPMTAADHIAAAEQLLAGALALAPDDAVRPTVVATAQAHATVALAISAAIELAVKRDALDHWQATDPLQGPART
jgi:hypothetical protein